MSSLAKQLEQAERLPDGTVVRLRSLRPEDETLLQDFALHMSPEDMRLRFFAPMRGLTHELATQLSHIDEDRDGALLAIAEGAEEVLGVAQFFADLDGRSAEFAIAVRSDWKAHGLGHLLLARLIQLARQRGIDELVGEVLPENAAMLRLCREFGFTVGTDPRDPKLRRVSKTMRGQTASHASAGRFQGSHFNSEITGGRSMKLLPLAVLACLAATPVMAQQREVGPISGPRALNPSMSLSAPTNNPLQEQMRQDYATQLMGTQRELLQQNPSGLGRQEQAIGRELNGYTPR